MKWFRKQFQVVEIPVPHRPAELGKEEKEAVATLGSHPGFVYLLNKLKYERALLESQLKNSRHADLRAVEFLQSGIFWCGWLNRQLDNAVFQSSPKPPVDATITEAEVFEAVPLDIIE